MWPARCLRPAGADPTSWPVTIGDPHRVGQEDRIIDSKLSGLVKPSSCWSTPKVFWVTIPAWISLDKPKEACGPRAPVHVDFTTKGRDSALRIPVTALVGKAGGDFAVEVVRAAGRR